MEEHQEGIKIGGRNVSNLRYADDTTLVAGFSAGLKNMLDKVKKASEKAGLYLNTKKTKVMANKDLETFTLDNEQYEVVDSFVLLGSAINKEGDCSSEIKRRIALGRVAMSGLDRTWKDNHLSTATKVRLVKAMVFPVTLYGCETWTMHKRDRNSINSFEHWCWRRMLRIPWMAKRTNESITAEVGESVRLANKVIQQKLSYFGHVTRGDSFEKSIMLGMGNGSRRRGRPRTRWMEDILKATDMTLPDAIEAARDRNGWRKRVRVVARGLIGLDGTK